MAIFGAHTKYSILSQTFPLKVLYIRYYLCIRLNSSLQEEFSYVLYNGVCTFLMKLETNVHRKWLVVLFPRLCLLAGNYGSYIPLQQIEPKIAQFPFF